MKNKEQVAQNENNAVVTDSQHETAPKPYTLAEVDAPSFGRFDGGRGQPMEIKRIRATVEALDAHRAALRDLKARLIAQVSLCALQSCDLDEDAGANSCFRDKVDTDDGYVFGVFASEIVEVLS